MRRPVAMLIGFVLLAIAGGAIDTAAALIPFGEPGAMGYTDGRVVADEDLWVKE